MVAKKSIEAPRNRTTLELDGDRAVIIRRRFNAPARFVFEAWTRADLVRRWWAPASHGVVLSTCEADVRVGGRYRYVLRRGDDEIGFSGEYLEISPPHRLVYTQVFEPMAENGSVTVTVTLTEQNGATELVAHENYPSAEVREIVIASGMESGMRETMEQLEALLAELDSAPLATAG